MQNRIGQKIKQLDNLITKRVYALYVSKDYPYISLSSLQTLEFLCQNPNHQATQKDIEKELVISRATASKMLSQLEEKGYITRTDAKADARRKIVTLTKRGRALYIHCNTGGSELDRFFSEVLTEEELQVFDTIYAKLRNALEK